MCECQKQGVSSRVETRTTATPFARRKRPTAGMAKADEGLSEESTGIRMAAPSVFYTGSILQGQRRSTERRVEIRVSGWRDFRRGASGDREDGAATASEYSD